MIKYFRMHSILFEHHTLRYLLRSGIIKSNLRDLQGRQKCLDEENQIIPLFKKALLFGNDICIKDFAGHYNYFQLYYNSQRLSRQISNICGSRSSSTVAFYGSNDILTMLIIWASWMSGQKVLPLKPDLSDHHLTDLVQGTKVQLVISSGLLEKCSKKLALKKSIPLIHLDHKFIKIYSLNEGFKYENANCDIQKGNTHSPILDEFYNNSEAIFANTNEEFSKTILRTHKELEAHIKKALALWNVSKDDKILCMCPSFHSYNDEYIFNLLLPLSVGGQVHILQPCNGKVAWRVILGINIPARERTNALIAEPKVYQQLIQEYEEMFAGDKRMVEYIREYCLNNIRLMMTCFYHVNPAIASAWFRITGHHLQYSNYSIERLNPPNFEDVRDESAHRRVWWSATRPNSRIRIVNANNNVLLELNATQTAKNFPTTSTSVIGRIMRSDNDDTFDCTGEIAHYCSGVLKIIGRYQM